MKAKTDLNETLDEIELSVEELEEVIAPGFPTSPRPNHNETLVRDGDEIELDFEELEEMIAPAVPGIRINHNETLITDEVELNVEELEEVIAPGITRNHNETLEVDLTIEELEEVIAPGTRVNHNETLVCSTE
jgi:predicted component of type VI protein secretion system